LYLGDRSDDPKGSRRKVPSNRSSPGELSRQARVMLFGKAGLPGAVEILSEERCQVPSDFPQNYIITFCES